MAKSNKQSYESKWQEVFNEAEVRPSAQLWKNIESDLNAAENAKFKRRILFYRVVSAAAVACVVILGIYTWSDDFGQLIGSKQDLTAIDQKNNDAQNTPETNTKALTENTDAIKNTEDHALQPIETTPPEASEENLAKSTETGNKADDKSQIIRGIDKINAPSFSPPLATNEEVASDDMSENKNLVSPMNGQSVENALPHASEKQSLLAMISSQGIEDSKGTDQSLTQAVAEIYPIPIMPKDKKDAFQPVFFAGLNLATDYFNPNYDAQPGQSLDAQNTFAYAAPGPAHNLAGAKADELPETVVNNRSLGEENTARLSFSYGVNFGMALTRHWIVESGVSYSKYNTSSQTNVAFQGIATDESYPISIANNSPETMRQFSNVRYEPTQLNNTFDFVAVPVKIGYNVSFDRINVVFGTGVAANFLLQNNISDDAGRLNEVTIKPDENSPFRKVYYSGVLSSGIHYQLMERYSFSVTPSYNFSISSLTKTESSFMSQPYSFGIDFGIRYQF